MQITLGGTVFSSKDAADKYLKLILANKNGYVVTEEEYAVLNDLLSRHPNATKKRGCGVSTFIVDASPKSPKDSCFYVVREDNSTTDFSKNKCLKPNNARTECLRCLRTVVEDDIKDAKKRMFDERQGFIECPHTGLKLGWEQCHADHEQPMTFEVICTTFVVGTMGLTFEEFQRKHIVREDNSVTRVTKGMSEQFAAYHHRVAKIRLIHGLRNCSQSHRFRMSRTNDGYLSLITTS